MMNILFMEQTPKSRQTVNLLPTFVFINDDDISRHFLTAVNQGGRTEKVGKKSSFFYFDEKGEKLKKNSRKFSF